MKTIDWYLENSEWVVHVTSDAYQQYYAEISRVFRKAVQRMDVYLQKNPVVSLRTSAAATMLFFVAM